MSGSFEKVQKNFGFGYMRLPMKGEDVDIPQTTAMVDAFLGNGFNYFDTAHGYINGKSELAIRECLSSRYPRERYILTNKLSANYFEKEEDIRPLFQQQLEACGQRPPARGPVLDSCKVLTPALVIQDKGHHIKSQTFLEHNESADSTVAILKGKDLLKPDMEIQYDGTVHSLPGFVFPEQFSQTGIDFLGRQQPAVPGPYPVGSIFPGCDALFSLINGAAHQHIVKILYEFLG